MKAFAAIDPKAQEALEADLLALLDKFDVARDGTLVVLDSATLKDPKTAGLRAQINALGWTTVLIYLCGAAGAAYFLTAGKAQRQAA